MSAADLLMHMHRGAAGPAGAPRTGPQHGPHLPARAPAGVIADPLRLAQELELVAAHMRSVADQAKFHVQSFRQHRRTSSSSSGSAESSSSFQSDHRVSSSSSSSSRQPNGGGQGSSINQQHAFRAKGTVSPEGKFEFEAEMGSATSAVKVSKNAAGDKQGQAQGQGGASLDSSWSIPVSELMHPDKIAAAGQGQGNKSPIGSGQEQEAEPVIQFPTQPDSPTPHRPSSSSDSTLTRAAAKPLRITETHELSEWPATWTWAQANKFAAPLMFTLLLSTILARWIAMRRAIAAHRARRGHKRVRHEQVVELQQVVDQVVTDERGNVIGVEETVSVEKRVMPTVASDSSPGHRNIQEHYDRKQRDWKFDAVRIPFWYTLSSLATLAMCLALDFLVLRPYTLPVAPPAAAAVNHPMVDFGLAVLHTGVVAATMASLARTVGFVRKEWDQYQRGE